MTCSTKNHRTRNYENNVASTGIKGETCSTENHRTRNYENSVTTTGIKEEICTMQQTTTKPTPQGSETTLNYLLTIYLIFSYLRLCPLKLKICHVMSNRLSQKLLSPTPLSPKTHHRQSLTPPR